MAAPLPLLFAPLLSAIVLLTPQVPERGPDAVAAAAIQAAATATVDGSSATISFMNRPVVELRATVLGRSPSIRAGAAQELVARLARDARGGRVTTHPYTGVVIVAIDNHPAFVIVQADADPLAAERIDSKAADAAARLQRALDESRELHDAGRVARAVALGGGVTALYVALLWLLIRTERRIAARVSRSAEYQLSRLRASEHSPLLTTTRTGVRRAFTMAALIVGALLTYGWLASLLRRFPYTRPWGESLRGMFASAVGSIAGKIVDALPDLFVLLVIVLATRFAVRMTAVVFEHVEQRRLTIPWVHPDTAPPTRRIVVALLWVFALIVSYEYLPGNNSDAFKGVSVFVGLVVSLGSTGIMNQVMSGLMVMYARGLTRGEFVRVGSIEGTVTSLGLLSTKLRTPRNEEVTIPNAVVVSQATTNYSRNRDAGVYASTSVTIGYDTPWRQVRALLLLAAGQTPGVRTTPAPVVLQMALHDFYVEYTLFVALEREDRRYFVLDVLHARILDAFNEYGVQIMSPRYVRDPEAPKVVPPDQWYPAPAAPDEPEPAAAAGVRHVHGV